MIIRGQQAIEYKRRHPGGELNKYNDPIEKALSDISIEKAEEVSREDPGLIWIEEVEAGADLEEMHLDSFFARVDAGELIPIDGEADGAEQLEEEADAGAGAELES
jgi:hypothetical protein